MSGESILKGRFFIVGVGPGDPDLLTIKGAKVLQRCDVWLVPSPQVDGVSTALSIAEGAVSSAGKEIIIHHFPMKHVHRNEAPPRELTEAWEKAAALIIERLQQGKDVAFPTLGDPAIYSTAFYVFEALQGSGVEVVVEVVPGVSAIGASAAAANMPLCLGSEHLVVIPATFEDSRIREILQICDSVALMKVYKVLPRLIAILDEFDLVEHAVLVEKTSLEGQRIWRDIRQAVDEDLHYFSTIIIHKR